MFLVVDITDRGAHFDRIAGKHLRVVGKTLLTMQQLRDRNFEIAEQPIRDAGFEFGGEEKRGRDRQIRKSRCARGLDLCVDRPRLSSGHREEGKAATLDHEFRHGKFSADPLLVDHPAALLDSFVEGNNAGAPQTEIVLQGESCVFNLPLISGAAKLLDQFGALRQAGGA